MMRYKHSTKYHRVTMLYMHRNLSAYRHSVSRYHPAVEKMKSLLEQYKRKPLIIIASYNCAYMDNPMYWNKAKTGGPIVEEATHFCDLLRYLGGEVREETISALSVEASNDPGNVGYLSAINEAVKESDIPAR